jgi:catechol 2,3-dioxygenase-like lactoylglutathione lyase family enzyme
MSTPPREAIRFHHIALGSTRITDALPVLVGRLGGIPESGGPSREFRWAAWLYAGGGRLEVIEPRGPDGFLHRFLARRGPGIHHVTFIVPSLAAACARAEAAGHEIVGRDESDPGWMTAFLHPKRALGIVVQIVQSPGEALRPWEVPSGPPDPPPAVRVVGLRLKAPSPDRARRQWVAILGAREEPPECPKEDGDGALVYRWPDSPMRIAVDVDPGAEAGPVAIEIATDEGGEMRSASDRGLASLFRETKVPGPAS